MHESDAVLTIGHSTRTIPEFVRLLQAGGVALVVDVRKMPGSRANPAYNIDALPGALAPFGIDYMRISELGGLRKQSKSVPAAVNAFWRNRSFHNYADYALSEPFRAGLAQLLDVSAARPTAIMCAEAVWWRCHRRIIADYLLHAGRAVYHLMGSEDVQIAVPTEAAVPSHDGLHYPSPASDDGSAGSSSSP